MPDRADPGPVPTLGPVELGQRLGQRRGGGMHVGGPHQQLMLDVGHRRHGRSVTNTSSIHNPQSDYSPGLWPSSRWRRNDPNYSVMFTSTPRRLREPRSALRLSGPDREL